MDQRKKNSKESHQGEEEDKKEPKTLLGIFTRQQFTVLSVAVGLVVLLLIIAIPSLVLTTNSGLGKFFFFLLELDLILNICKSLSHVICSKIGHLNVQRHFYVK